MSEINRDKIEILQEKFCGIFEKYGSKKSEAIELFQKIVKEYSTEGRAYHTLDHIENLLEFLEKQKLRIREWDSVRLAAWLHDVVYNTKTEDNEEQSAQYAQKYLKQLGVSEKIVSRVADLILATKKHETAGRDSDLEIFLDGDLAILGSIEKEYDKYSTNIRQEYKWFSDEQYKAGRKKALENFLNRPKIYFTEEAGRELEQRARKNLKREIIKLS